MKRHKNTSLNIAVITAATLLAVTACGQQSEQDANAEPPGNLTTIIMPWTRATVKAKKRLARSHAWASPMTVAVRHRRWLHIRNPQ